MPILFDGINKVISLPSSTPDISVKEMYSRWVDWTVVGDNLKYPQAMRYVGGDPLPGSKELGITYFLMNGWKIRPAEEDHTLTVNGNLYSEDGSSPYTSVLGSFQVMVINSVSNLVDSTVQQLPEIEHASFNGYVCYSPDSPYAGTGYPNGRENRPINNLADVLAVAVQRGFRIIKVLTPTTITAGQDVSSYTVTSDNWINVTIESGAVTTDTIFEKLSLYGPMCGTWNILIDCWVYDVTNFLGWMRGGSIERIELAPYIDPDPYSLGSSYFDHIVPMYANIPSVIAMNTGVSVSLTDCTDMVEINSMTNGSVVNASLLGGKVTIDSSCIGGAIVLSGVGKCINNSDIVVDDHGLLNEDLIPEAVMSYTRV